MAEKPTYFEKLNRLPFAELAIPRSYAGVFLTLDMPIKPIPPQLGISVRQSEMDYLYTAENLTGALEQSLALGYQEKFNLHGRHQGDVAAGYILDTFNLIKPDFRAIAPELIYSAADNMNNRLEHFNHRYNREIEDVHRTLVFILGCASARIWSQNKYGLTRPDGYPRSDTYLTENQIEKFLAPYLDKAYSQDTRQYATLWKTYQKAFYEEIVWAKLLPGYITLDEFRMIYKNNTLEYVINLYLFGSSAAIRKPPNK